MQYILTEKEYNDLVAKGKETTNEKQRTINKLCRKIADKVPQTDWRNQARHGEPASDPKPWGCIHTVLDEDDQEWYCDECQVQNCCTMDKNFSQ